VVAAAGQARLLNALDDIHSEEANFHLEFEALTPARQWFELSCVRIPARTGAPSA
jgi:hypothetical protein